jgi:hypothetical protein
VHDGSTRPVDQLEVVLEFVRDGLSWVSGFRPPAGESAGAMSTPHPG